MEHRMYNKEKTKMFTINMYCGHPRMRTGSTTDVGCAGNCESCKYSKAECTIPEMLELLKLANCNYIN